MNIVHFAVAPRMLMPPTMMFTVVVTFLVTLFVPGVVMDHLAILNDTTG